MKVLKYVVLLGTTLFLLAGCKPAVNPVNPGEKETGPENIDNGGSIVDGKYVPLKEAVNPSIGDGKRKKSLQYLFNTDSVGESEIYIKRSEWNKMLEYYDYFYKNENTVAVEQFTYKKDGMKWDLKDCGMRLRGNTSRFRPQGKDYPTDETGHTMPNASWSSSYYEYAANCPDDDYRQAHFKVDFEPYEEKQKLAGCMKGVALKRMDAAYSREILCYDLFHENNVFSATRASHTKVTIYMIEDDDTVTPVDFGVYEMFEEVNDQFLKARDEIDKNAEHTFTHWANPDGDLWKCGGDLTPGNIETRAGVEEVYITSNGEKIKPGETKDKDTWYYTDNRYGYDLKTNKKKFDAAKGRLLAFADELEALRNLPVDDVGIAQRKAFYEKWFYMDLFLTTYAVNVAVGMDDDYWANHNNFYLYFDNATGGTGKCFLIPFDYDNTLGQSINGDGVYNNPLNWGYNHKENYVKDSPLMDRLLEVPEYRNAYKQKLLEVTAETSAWSMEKSGAKVTKWKNLVSVADTDGKPLTYSKNLDHAQALTDLYWVDYGGWKTVKHYLNSEPSIYDHVRESFEKWIDLDGGIEIDFNFNGGTGIDPSTMASTDGPVTYTLKSSEFNSLEGVILYDEMVPPKKANKVFAGWTKTRDKNDFVTTEIVSPVYAKWVDISEITDLYICELTPDMDGYNAALTQGIQFKILNPPSYRWEGPKTGSWRRNIYVNGIKISEDDNREAITADKWYFPFTNEGEIYSIRISYKGSDYGTEVLTTNTLKVVGDAGYGDFKYTNSNTKLGFNVNGNTFTYDVPQGIYAGGLVKEGYTPGYFEVRFHDSNWKYSSGYEIYDDYKINPFDLYALIMEKNNWTSDEVGYMVDYAFGRDMYPTLNYMISGPDSSYGKYRLEIPVEDRGVRATDCRIKLSKDSSGKYPGLMLDMNEFSDGIPEETVVRQIFINDVRVQETQSNSDVVQESSNGGLYIYPFVTAGEKYKVEVRYYSNDGNGWGHLKTVEKEITAESGIGENKVIVRPEYKVVNNELKWIKKPVLNVAGEVLASDNNPGKYKMTFRTRNWSTWFGEISTCDIEIDDFNIAERMERYFAENSWNTQSVQSMKDNGNSLVIDLDYNVEISGIGTFQIRMEPYIEGETFALN